MYIDPSVFVVLALFIVKHFVADYPLQNSYMIRKFSSRARQWVPALGAHCAVHALLTLVIIGCFSGYLYVFGDGKIIAWKAYSLAAVDFVLHFIMDRIKASPNMWGQYRAMTGAEMEKAFTGLRHRDQKVRFASLKRIKANKYFWCSLGFDQMFHHLTDLLVVYLLFTWGK